MSEVMLTSEELAARWSMAEHTLRNWRVSGRGPRFVKIGGMIRYLVEDVVAFEKGEIKPKKKRKSGSR
jgi:hypothetical protein